MSTFSVSIIQDDCTGCGNCPEFAPKYFYMGDDDGIAYVQDPTDENNRPKGIEGTVNVADSDIEEVLDAIDKCPVDCIYLHEVTIELVS